MIPIYIANNYSDGYFGRMTKFNNFYKDMKIFLMEYLPWIHTKHTFSIWETTMHKMVQRSHICSSLLHTYIHTDDTAATVVSLHFKTALKKNIRKIWSEIEGMSTLNI